MVGALKNGLEFSRDPLGFMGTQQERKGDYSTSRLGFNTVHFIFDPELAREVLGNPLAFVKTRFVYDKIKPVTGDTGMVQIEGE